MDVLDAILSIDRPSFIYITGELVLERWLNENTTNGRFYYDDDNYDPYQEEKQIQLFETPKIEIYINAGDCYWDLQRNITYCKKLYDEIEDPIFDLDDDDFMPVVYYLNQFIHNIGESLKINTINKLYPTFGFGEHSMRYKIENEEGGKHWRTKDTVVVNTIGLQSYLLNKLITVKFVLCFKPIEQIVEYPLDVFGVFIDYKNTYNDVGEDMEDAFEEKNAILYLDGLKEEIKGMCEYLSAKYVYRLIKKIIHLISIGWKIYLDYKICYCQSRNCLCKVRIDSSQVSAIINGITVSNYYFDKMVKVDKSYNILELRNDRWVKTFERAQDYMIIDRNNEEYLQNHIIYINIINRLILNREFILFTLKPENFLKFHAHDW